MTTELMVQNWTLSRLVCTYYARMALLTFGDVRILHSFWLHCNQLG